GRQPVRLRRPVGGLEADPGVPSADCALLTVPANDLVRPANGRMPAILSPGDYAAWIDRGRSDPDGLLALARPFPAEGMEAVPAGHLRQRPAARGARLPRRP